MLGNHLSDNDRPLFRYAVGPLALVVALVLKELGFTTLGSERPFLLLFAPIMLSAWHGGAGPAVLTTFLAAAASDYFFLPPLHSFGQFDRTTFIQLSIFILEGLTISALGAAMHRTKRRADQTERDITKLNEELEQRVVERTAQLREANRELESEITERKRKEEQLRRSEHQLATAQEIASVGSWEWDIQENKVAWSDELYRIYGIPPKSREIDYETFLNSVHPEDRAMTEETIRRAFSNGRPFSFYHRIVRPDGAVRTLHARGEVILGPNGQPVRMIGTGQDITERRAAEEELRRTEAFLNSIVENLPNMIFVKEAKELRFVRFNKAGEALLGYSREELIGKNDTDFFPKEQADFFISKDREVLRDGYLLNIPEEPIQTKHHGTRILATKKIPLYDKDGKPLYLLGISEDITERKKMEAEREQLVREQTARIEAEAVRHRLTFLSEASALLASSLEYEATLSRVAQLAVPRLADWCTVSMAEEEGSIRQLAVAHINPEKIHWAQEMERRYPLDPNAPRGVGAVLRSGRSEIYPEISDALLAGAVRDDEHLRILRELGIQSAMIVPLIVQGRPVGAITFVSAESGWRYNESDLSLAEELARRAAVAIENARLYRQAQDANRAKDEFLAVVSHELRTPLNAILGWSQLLHSGELDPETTARALESIGRNATAQTQLIEDLLDVSRIVSGKLHLNVHQVEIGPIIQAAIDTVQPAADAKEISLSCRLSEPSIFVLGDSDRLQQVIWNLLSNSIKFTPEQGRVSVEVTRSNLHVVIQVSDTGIGIAPDFLPFVFDRFRQANSSSTRSHSGLGLGLAIVRHLVELHGGTVSVESPGEGKGAIFTVILPVRSVRLKEEAAYSPSASVPGASLDGLRVLVVDDEADARDLVTTALRRCQAEVKAVSSAQEAMSVFEEAWPDVLVSDIAMPNEDGYGLIRKVRALAPERGGNTPAVALTAYARSEDRAKILSSGFQVYLSKPIEPAHLVASVAKLVKKAG